MSGIGIITNPHSKLNKRNPERKALLGYILGTQGTLEATESIEDLGRVAREFKTQKVSTLAINGGDGTISRTLTAFIKEYGDEPLPQVAILRGGTINVLAANLGVKGTPEEILYRLTQQYSLGAQDGIKRLELSTIEVDGNYGFLFGNGITSNFLKEYYKRKSGPVGALWWGIRVWGSRFYGGALYRTVVKDSYQTLEAKNHSPQNPGALQKIGHTTCAVFCSTLPKMPLGYPLFRNVQTNPRSFECVSFTFSADDAVWQLPLTLLKMGKDPKRRLSLCTNELTIDAGTSMDYTIDGELYESSTGKITIRVGPALDFLVI